MNYHHLRLDGSGCLGESVTFLEVVERELLPFGIPSDGFIEDAEGAFWAAGEKRGNAGQEAEGMQRQSGHGRCRIVTGRTKLSKKMAVWYSQKRRRSFLVGDEALGTGEGGGNGLKLQSKPCS